MNSPFEWSDSDLTDYLTQYGIDNLDMMDQDEKAALVFSLLQTTTDIAEQGARTSDAVATNAAMQTHFEDTVDADPMDVPTDPIEDEALRAAATAAAERDSAQYEEAITHVSDLTGCDKQEARHLLEAVGWDIEAAVNMSMMEHDAGAPQVAPPVPAPMRSSDFPDPTSMPGFLGAPLGQQRVGGVGFRGPMPRFDDTDVDNAFARMNAEFFGNMGGGGRRMPGFGNMGTFNGMHHGYDYDEPAGPVQDEYDEEGVRRPDPVKMQRLMSVGSEEDAALGRADAPNVEWMFPPPSHLSYPGPLQEARDMAKSEKKWILVNIQSHEDFSSHMLNRDTWSDDTVVSLLRTSFVFWQRGHTSPDGQAYMRMHGITDADLPHIAIIDSRTGARIVTMKGFVSQSELSMALLEYLDENSFDNTKPPKNRFIDSSKDFDRKVSLVDGSHKAQADDDEGDAADFGDAGSNLHSGRSAAAAVAATADTPPAAPIESKKAPAFDYGAVPDEPDVGDADTLKVSLKLLSGKNVIRRFKKSEVVRGLYAFALSLTPEAVTEMKDFDLFTTYPPKCLREVLEVSMQDAGLAGSQVIIRWV